MPLRGRIFLGARFRLVSFLQIWERTDYAHEVDTFEYHRGEKIAKLIIFELKLAIS